MSRWIAFLLSILIGLAIGLYYGWVLSPVEYVNTTPDTLRVDYKTDYILMIAEIHQVNGDTANAVRRLGLLGDDTPITLTQQALDYAQTHGYGQSDLTLITHLADSLKTWNPAEASPGEGAP
ncbi:MAG: hypothetical protein HUU38_10735 [Anaerolineales bacterium]|nr:hypothetical protein [Anaerolineales bacterium]